MIGGGLPVGAFGGRAEIMDQLSPDGPVYQAGTFLEIRWRWPRVWRNCASSNGSTDGNCSRTRRAIRSNLRRSAIKNTKTEVTFHRIGSMFCLFFAPGPIVDLAARGGAI